MKAFLLILAATGSLVEASMPRHSPLLSSRQLVEIPCSEQGRKPCGEGYCILPSYTCCPDESGGCPSSTYCSLGSNNVYGCCPRGEICVGDGGVDTGDGETFTFTQTSWIESTSTTSFTLTEESTISATLPIETPTESVPSVPSPEPSGNATATGTGVPPVPTDAAVGLAPSLIGAAVAIVAVGFAL